MPTDPSELETVLLLNPTGGESYFAEIPINATLYRVPSRCGLPEPFLGQIFCRDGRDAATRLPRFRRRSRQA